MASFYDAGWRKGPWTPQEDRLLVQYITHYGEGRWSSVSKCTGLKRSGKSCRLRWVNYLRPGLKKGHLSPQEEAIIIELHALWGNKWSTIARYLPGRTDNEIKNYWRTHFKPRKPCDQMKQQKSKEFESTDSDINNFNDEFIEAVDDGATNVEEIEFPSIENNQLARFPSIDKNQLARFPSIDKNQLARFPSIDKNQLARFPSIDKNQLARFSSIDKNQIVPMMDQETTDFIPIDCYLWGGLWNLDDQNQPNSCYSDEGQNGVDFIF